MQAETTRRRRWAAMGLTGLMGGLALGACNRSAPPAGGGTEAGRQPAASVAEVAASAPSDLPAEAVADARSIFAQRCTMCHGPNGKGDGVAAASLSPKPQDYTQAAWQKATSDETIRKVILGGGPAVGKSMMMPANPDLQDKPQVVEGLVAIVRSLGKA